MPACSLAEEINRVVLISTMSMMDYDDAMFVYSSCSEQEEEYDDSNDDDIHTKQQDNDCNNCAREDAEDNMLIMNSDTNISNDYLHSSTSTLNSNTACHNDYIVLSPSDLLSEQNKAIRQVMEVMGMASPIDNKSNNSNSNTVHEYIESCAFYLLKHFKWNTSHAVEEWFQKEEEFLFFLTDPTSFRKKQCLSHVCPTSFRK